MKDDLNRIAGTALLCGGLGYGLYLAMAEAARFPELTVAILGLACSGALATLLAREIVQGLRSGIVPWRPFAIRRDREPAWFWGSLVFSGLCLLLSLWLLAYSLGRLPI